MNDEIFIGIDVSKAWLDIACLPVLPVGKVLPTRVANEQTAHVELLGQLKQLAPCLVVLEATGGFETALARCLYLAGIAVAVINPKRIRDFAKAAGMLAKTDRLDAKALALFAQRMRPEVRPLPDDVQQEIIERVDRRAQLVSMRAQEKTRLSTVKPVARDSVREHIQWLDTRIKEIEGDLDTRLKQSSLYQPKYALLDSVPGLGRVTITMMLGRLPELGTLNNKRVAALAGVAPFADDSGKRRGQRYIRGGRADVRTALYMATLTATRHNRVIRAMFQRLREKGKPFKLALTACMRKLLTILNAILRTGVAWRETPEST